MGEPSEDPEELSPEEKEPEAKRRKLNDEVEIILESGAAKAEDEDLSGAETDDDMDEDVEAEVAIARGTKVAVAYGSLDGLSKRKWYAATVICYNGMSDTYTVQWKYPPRKNPVFEAESARVKPIPDDDFAAAPKRGTGFVGIISVGNYILERKLSNTSEESVEETEGPTTGDYVAVAYGNPRANKAGVDTTKRNTKKYKKRFLWYAATITQDFGDKGFEVEWKHPCHKARTFVAPKAKVQPITAKEWRRAKMLSRGKPSYGMVGIHRVATKVNLTSG